MITYTGEHVWPYPAPAGEPDLVAPSLTSIGVGLGRIARFSGQTREWYNVLGHTLVVADLVDVTHAIYALLHDAPESIVGDVPTTWKTPATETDEDDLLRRITTSLDLPWPWPEDAHQAVKRADRLALAAEAHVLGHAAADQYWPASDLDDQAVERTRDMLPRVMRHLDADVAGTVYRGAVQWACKERA